MRGRCRGRPRLSPVCDRLRRLPVAKRKRRPARLLPAWTSSVRRRDPGGSRAGATALSAHVIRPVHIARPARPLEQADHGRGRVDLTAIEAVTGATGLAVMAVV